MKISEIEARMSVLVDDMNNKLNHPPMEENLRIAFIVLALPLLKVPGEAAVGTLEPFVPGPLLQFGNVKTDGDPMGAKIMMLQRALEKAVADLHAEDHPTQ